MSPVVHPSVFSVLCSCSLSEFGSWFYVRCSVPSSVFGAGFMFRALALGNIELRTPNAEPNHETEHERRTEKVEE